ncbi:FAR-17a/AIG1-like protein-domain-containing protein [Scheffersomyces amazonensis]|uniref:FAR-17a/AIG1-like protein-domain-containing protein n=1 Tax=Scheffersomyces amazonensis TaxID=1078765 RepID=UPI00315C76DE
MSARRVVGNPIILAIDAVSIILGSIGAYYVVFAIELPPALADAGPWQFLTNLSLVYSLIIFGIGFVAHLTKSQLLFELKNNIHPIGLALESVVAIIYWPLRLFFLRLLIGDHELNLPMSIDLCIHLLPVSSLLIDFLVFMPRWTIRIETAFLIVAGLTTGYWTLLKYLIDTEKGGIYPYAFLNVDSEQKRIVVFSIVAAVGFTQFLFLRSLYDNLIKFTEQVEDEIDSELEKKNL